MSNDESTLIMGPRGGNWSSRLLGLIALYSDRMACSYLSPANDRSFRLPRIELGCGSTPVKASLMNHQIGDYYVYDASTRSDRIAPCQRPKLQDIGRSTNQPSLSSLKQNKTNAQYEETCLNHSQEAKRLLSPRRRIVSPL